MNAFKYLFGIEQESIQKTCILAPFLTRDILRDFRCEEFNKGKPYQSAQGKGFTLIHTRVGSQTLGDAVLYLEESPCENILFLGACGLIPGNSSLKIGSITAPAMCYNMESFSKIVTGAYKDLSGFAPNALLFDKLLEINSSISKVNCATVGSIKLEEECVDLFKKNRVEIVDLECSAFYSAALKIKRKAVALLYATDIIAKSQAFDTSSKEEKSHIIYAQRKSAEILLRLTQQMSERKHASS